MLAQGDCYKSEDASAISKGVMDKKLRDILQPDTSKRRNRGPGEAGVSTANSSTLGGELSTSQYFENFANGDVR